MRSRAKAVGTCICNYSSLISKHYQVHEIRGLSNLNFLKVLHKYSFYWILNYFEVLCRAILLHILLSHIECCIIIHMISLGFQQMILL